MASKSRQKAGTSSAYSKSRSKSGMFQKMGTSAKMGGMSSKTAQIQQRKQSKGMVDEFVGMLKKDSSIKSVENKMGINMIGSIKVGKEFQKADFTLNRMGQMTTKGWDLQIPDKFIKVSDTKYVAPTVKYTSDYYNPSKRGKRTQKSYGTYVPTELILDKGGKLQKVIKRGTYKDSEQSSDKGRDYSRKVYETEVQDFEGGVLTSRKRYDDYTTKKKDYSSGKRKEQSAIYLKSESAFNPYGRIVESRHYDDYLEGGKYSSSAKYQTQKEAEKGYADLAKSMYGKSAADLNYAQRQQFDKSWQTETRQDAAQQVTRTRKDYKTGLRSIKYYDNWGQPIDTINIW